MVVTDAMDTDLLTHWISRKLALLVPLCDLSRRQSALVDEGDIQRLLSVLAAKQTLLAELQKVERQLEPYRHQDPDARCWRSPADRERCRQLAERCEQTLCEIVQLEQQSESQLVARRDAAAAQLQGSHSTTEATRAYLGPAVVPRGTLDLTSDG